MASSGAVQNKLESTNGLDLIWESRALYAEILFCFRECHDLCVSSDLFTKDIILQVDQCAVDFRQLSLDTVTVAKRVSNQWLDTAIAFFENIDDVDDPKEILILLGSQARELAICFKIIAAWARDLAGRFNQAQGGTIKEADEFKKRFAAAVERAEDVKKQVKLQLQKAAKKCQEAQLTEEKWNTARIWLAWNPIALALTSIGCAFAARETAEASKIEEEATDKLRIAQDELERKESQNEKAKFIASKAATLVEVLGKLEVTCEAVAAFWTQEAENYDSQGAKMATNQTIMLKSMKGVVVKNNIKFWTSAKDRMERYVTAMTLVNNCFNFVTDAKPPSARSFSLPNLELTLHVPASVDIKAIKA